MWRFDSARWSSHYDFPQVTDLSTADYRRLVDLLEENSSRSMEAMRVMLTAMKEAGWDDFDACWSNAIQRIRVQPYMSGDEAAELLEDKATLTATKPAFRAAFHGQPIPRLDDDPGGSSESRSAESGMSDH